MNIRLDEISDRGLLLEEEVSPDTFPQLTDIAAAGDARFPEVIRYRIKINRIAGIVEVVGSVETVVELNCGRCLDSYQMPFSSDFFVAYTQELPECIDEDDEGIELSAEEMGLTLLEGDELSLLEPVQEHLLVALPIQPLCENTCQGLCAHCGCNLNDSDCKCQESPFDTRFSSLKNLKINQE